MRQCSKPGCQEPAAGTLTYDYGNSTAVVGPLATTAEPHSYDLCERHIRTLTVPKGWDVVRLEINYDQVPPSDDDLMALAQAVRDAAEGRYATGVAAPGRAAFTGGASDAFTAASSPDSDASGDSDAHLPHASQMRRRGRFEVVTGNAEILDPPAEPATAGAGEPELGPFSA